jgi:Domain of unknown function (DUF1877)
MGMTGYLQQISPESLRLIESDSSSITSIVFPEEDIEDTSLDIDKAWQGLHFLLTGEEWGGGDPPLAYTILGGSVIEDTDFVACFYVTPEQVKEVAEALSTISEADLVNKCKSEEMVNVYPFNLTEEFYEEDLDYLLGYFKDIVEYYQSAAEKGYAMLIYIT